MAAKRSNVKSRQKSDTTDAHERVKDFLDEGEIERLLAAARGGRHGVRDHLLMLMMYRHGLRVSEAIGLRREHVNLQRARLWVERLKGSLSVEHPITGDELRHPQAFGGPRRRSALAVCIRARGASNQACGQLSGRCSR